MKYFVGYQLDLIMMLGGICGFIFLFLQFMRIEDKKKKSAFMQIAFFAMLLLFVDRLAYLYRGDESTLGYYMVRICNFLVFACILLVENGFNHYLFSFARAAKLEEKRTGYLRVNRLLVAVGMMLLVISQFTGLYYTFDETNHYQRSAGFIICYLMPILMTAFQFEFIMKNKKIFHKRIFNSLLLFMGVPLIAGVIQVFFYGLSLTSVSFAISAISIYFFALADQNHVLVKASRHEMNRAKVIQETANKMLNQTVEALASAVDAKDAYTHGHSTRVAKYAKSIAQMAGMTEEDCEDVYLAGLLHDVGKIGIDNKIINKNGKLTDEEFAIIKQHPVLGGDILSKIAAAPSLSVGARYHHERYDGKGYPENLKGEDIPQIARIIAVADAYDAMTSKRSYRDMIPQMYVREELVKGIGTQFDPNYARIMLHMLDQDVDYKMKESKSEEIFGADSRFTFDEYKTKVTAGIRITECPTKIEIQYEPLQDGGMPSLLFYDSADARYYLEKNSLSEEMDFIEYASVGMNGDVSTKYVRQMKMSAAGPEKPKAGKVYKASIQMIKQEDHMLVRIKKNEQETEIIFALYDASRFIYLALTGENCDLDILAVDVAENEVEDNYVPRIAEKITYIEGHVGDIPNVQIDGWRSDHSEIMEVTDHMEISFRTMSLPSSRRLWHCPMICLFTSDDGKIDGPNYTEVALARMDGEVWCDVADIVNVTSSSKGETFENWSVWKQKNREGVECKVLISHQGNNVNLQIENSGLLTVNQTRLPENVEKVYWYFTGDQCAITDIRIR